MSEQPGKVDAKLGADVFKLDQEPHILIDLEKCRTVCTSRACLKVCPADLYERNDQGGMTVNWEGCLECGTCLICCDAEGADLAVPAGRLRRAVPDELEGRRGGGPCGAPPARRPVTNRDGRRCDAVDIAVCVKTNPDLQLVRVKDRVPVLEAVPYKVGDLEKNALEAALRLRDAAGDGRVVAVTVAQGDRKIRETMKEALAIGADEAVIVADPALDDTDQAGAALALAARSRSRGRSTWCCSARARPTATRARCRRGSPSCSACRRSATRATSRPPARSCAPSAAWARTWRPSRRRCRPRPPW